MANWIDRTIAYLSPEAGLRRAQMRAALSAIAARSYDAAQVNRRTAGWQRFSTSANAEVAGALQRVRDSSRQMVRNNPHARRAISVLVAKSIGTGIRARVPATAKAAWEEFVENCDASQTFDLYGLQSLIARTGYQSGECLVRRIRGNRGRVPLKLQVLEADYIDGTKNGVQDNGLMAIAGVEVDQYGAAQNYWLYDHHPGEIVAFTRSHTSHRVPASEIILFGERERPGQIRCMPRLATSMMRLAEHDDWRDAVILKKKIEACFVAFVHGAAGSNTLVGAGQTETETVGGRRTETLAPGMIKYLTEGQEVTFGNPSAAVDGGFSKEELHAIAIGADCTYEQLTGDLSQVNYSSIRAGMADFVDIVEMYRWLQFIPQVMRPIRDWFLDAGFTQGSLRSPNYGFVWTPPAWPYVNPVDDIKASKEEIKGGLQSLSEKIRQRGYDPEEVFAEMASDRKVLEKFGIKVDTDIANEPASSGRGTPAEPPAEPSTPPGDAE